MKHLYISIILLSLIVTPGCKKEEAPVSNTIVAKKGFSINPNNQVYFAKGNLQYQASTLTWRFADNQWETIGNNNSNISETYDGWIDLFGWGTSGNNHGAVCFQPWSISQSDTAYYAYGGNIYNLSDQTGEADWGHNTISNSNNDYNWKTLSKDEWKYLFYTRETPSNIRYAKATVNGKNGMILLPDNWNSSNFTLNNTNTHNVPYSSNTISENDWNNIFETNNAVFLPVTGCRANTMTYFIDSYGYYWSSSFVNNYYSRNNAYYVFFNEDMFYADFYESFYVMPLYYGRSLGQAVRLVRTVE